MRCRHIPFSVSTGPGTGIMGVLDIAGWRGVWLAAVRWIPVLGPRLVGRTARRLMPGGPPPAGPPDEPDAGVREPRRPGPLAGAGAVALPEPVEG